LTLKCTIPIGLVCIINGALQDLFMYACKYQTSSPITANSLPLASPVAIIS